jgi:ribosomal protein L11 methyltransferase
VPLERAEEARAVLIELSPAGWEEREEGGNLELALFVSGEEARERIESVFGEAEAEDVDPGWRERWRAFHRPARLGPLWIGPPWLEPEPGAIVVVIDPGQAFGTGAHATTQLCLELVLAEDRGALVDIGCGSGVVAIAAAKLGFSPVAAIDLDPIAVRVATENAAANAIDLRAARADALRDPIPAAGLAVANLELALIAPVAARLRSDRLIASGYLVAEHAEPEGFTLQRRLERDGWAAELFTRR